MTSSPLHLEIRDHPGEKLAERIAAALRDLPHGRLPLQACCNQGGWVDESDLEISVLRVEEGSERILAEIGVFFAELVGGCNCNDDPVSHTAYCQMRLAIEGATGSTTVEIVHD